MILAVIDDMLFRSKVEAAAAQSGALLHIATHCGALAPLLESSSWRIALVDLNLSTDDPLAFVRIIHESAPALPLVGYCAHVQRDLKARALAAGCTTVLPRSLFIQRLPHLLTGAV